MSAAIARTAAVGDCPLGRVFFWQPVTQPVVNPITDLHLLVTRRRDTVIRLAQITHPPNRPPTHPPTLVPTQRTITGDPSTHHK